MKLPLNEKNCPYVPFYNITAALRSFTFVFFAVLFV